MPDIMLLAPIARLLDVSLDTLLAFQEELTDREVNELVRTVNEKMKSEDYAAVFRWAKKKWSSIQTVNTCICGCV